MGKAGFEGVRTRRALPGELSVTAEKLHLVGRSVRRLLMERHVKECPVRFDVVAIEKFSGHAPVVRVHKNAFNPWM
jgi:Holliday junction resolvase-like predicted endonuclease